MISFMELVLKCGRLDGDSFRYLMTDHTGRKKIYRTLCHILFSTLDGICMHGIKFVVLRSFILISYSCGLLFKLFFRILSRSESVRDCARFI